MQKRISFVFTLTIFAMLTGCVSWNRDIEVPRLTQGTPANLPVPRAWTHSASKLDLCVALDAGYRRDIKGESFVDDTGAESKIVAKGHRASELVSIGSRYYIGQNLVCFEVADDRVGSPFSSIELSSSNADLRVNHVYWHWGHYL